MSVPHAPDGIHGSQPFFASHRNAPRLVVPTPSRVVAMYFPLLEMTVMSPVVMRRSIETIPSFSVHRKGGL